MADGAVFSDRQRKTHVGMTGRIVLHIGVFADLDPLVVAAHTAPNHTLAEFSRRTLPITVAVSAMK